MGSSGVQWGKGRVGVHGEGFFEKLLVVLGICCCFKSEGYLLCIKTQRNRVHLFIMGGFFIKIDITPE